MFASIPDLLRLVAVPFFGFVAYRDIKTRRVPNQWWYPLAALAIVLLVWDTYAMFTGDVVAWQRRRFLVGVAFSIFFVIPLVYGFWLIGGFGGADTKAFFVIALLFPVFPDYRLWELADGLNYLLPLVRPDLPVFSLTILSNTVIAGVFYPVALALRNGLSGYVSPGMFVAKPVRWDETTEEYGTLLSFPDRGLTDDLSLSGLRNYFAWRGLDLDALRMYLQWRGLTLAEVRENPAQYRDPDSLPEEPNAPGDGVIADGGQPVDDGTDEDDMSDPAETERAADDSDENGAGDGTDPWGAEAFLDDIEGTAYGTTPEKLREGMETLTTEETVWISPGIPFLVPLFFGLVTSLLAGDLLFAGLDALGLV